MSTSTCAYKQLSLMLLQDKAPASFPPLFPHREGNAAVRERKRDAHSPPDLPAPPQPQGRDGASEGLLAEESSSPSRIWPHRRGGRQKGRDKRREGAPREPPAALTSAKPPASPAQSRARPRTQRKIALNFLRLGLASPSPLLLRPFPTHPLRRGRALGARSGPPTHTPRIKWGRAGPARCHGDGPAARLPSAPPWPRRAGPGRFPPSEPPRSLGDPPARS